MKAYHVNSEQSAQNLNKLYNGIKDKTYNIVLLVMYYMPGCHACVQLYPVWNKIKNANPYNKILFVQLNSSFIQNTVLPSVTSFPSIYLITHTNNIKFNKERSYINLFRFLQHNLKRSVDFSDTFSYSLIYFAWIISSQIFL